MFLLETAEKPNDLGGPRGGIRTAADGRKPRPLAHHRRKQQGQFESLQGLEQHRTRVPDAATGPFAVTGTGCDF